MLRLAIASCLAALSIAGCDSDTSSTVAAKSTDGPGRPTPSSTRQISLTCADSVGPGTPADSADLDVAGITFSGVPANGPAPAGSIELGPSDNPSLFRKVFLYVSPESAGETLLEIVAPDDGRLYYTDEDHWGGANGDSYVLTGAAKSVLVPRCGDTSRGFLGGIVATSSVCVTLAITPVGGSPRTVRIPVTSGTC